MVGTLDLDSEAQNKSVSQFNIFKGEEGPLFVFVTLGQLLVSHHDGVAHITAVSS